MNADEVSRDTEWLAEKIVNAHFWSGSFYTDNALDLLRERYDELMRERRGQIEGTRDLVNRAEANLRSTGLQFAA